MPKSTTPIPPGFHTLTPHLTVRDAAAYIEFLKHAFDAVETSRSPGPGGKLMHVTVRIGDSPFMFNDDFSEMFHMPPFAEGRMPYVMHLYVPDADASWAKALAAGCTVVHPLADQFWGSRYGQVMDPFGVTWSIATHIEDVTPAEAQERAAKAFGGGPQ
jgi:PhnB protein